MIGRTVAASGTAALVLLILTIPAGAAPLARVPADSVLADSVRTLLADERYPEAVALATERVARNERQSGRESLPVANALRQLIAARLKAEYQPVAETCSLAVRAIRLRERLEGEDHIDLATPWAQLSDTYALLGQPADARRAEERSLAIREHALGPDHVDVASSCTRLGHLLIRQGEFAVAESLYQRAYNVRVRLKGPDDPSIAPALSDLGNVALATDRFAAAESLLERGRSLIERAYGPDDRRLVFYLNNLGMLYIFEGDYEGSRASLERAIAIMEKTAGPEAVAVGSLCNNLALSLMDQGDFEAARPLFERALRIAEKVMGPDHPTLPPTLSNYGSTLFALGDSVGGLHQFERGVAILDKAYPGDHPARAYALQEACAPFLAMRDTTRALEAARSAIAMFERLGGPDDASVARALVTQAGMQQNIGRFAEAKESYERAIRIDEADQGADRLQVALDLYNYAGLLMATGHRDAARAAYARALEIRERVLGPRHPDVAECLGQLARAEAEAGDTLAALDTALRAERIGREHLVTTSRALAERQALHYAQVRVRGLDLAMRLVVGGRGGDAPARVLDEEIRGRALVLDLMSARHRRVLVGGDRVTDSLRVELALARQRLANLALRPADSDPSYRKTEDIARDRVESIVADLARRGGTVDPDAESAGLADVVRVLERGEALVSYVRYRSLAGPGEAMSSAGLEATAVTRSASAQREHEDDADAAFVYVAGSPGPVVVGLGTAAGTDSLVRAWRACVSGPGDPGMTGEAFSRARGEALRRRIWDPIATLLRGARRVFVVPDGSLNLVNFAALPAARDGYLVEADPAIQLLGAERDLLGQPASRRGEGLLVIGGPDFDRVESTPVAGDGLSAVGAITLARGARSACADLNGKRFAALPGARREADEIAALWKRAFGHAGVARAAQASAEVRELIGPAATATAFAAWAPGRRVVHVATHGFFLDGDCGATAASRRVESPLLHAGLVFAGANRRAAGQSSSPDADDGILTAEEISGMDLRGVECAVLSACETGVGRVEPGEGVLGLRRAFRSAGAANVVMSLWPVVDESTTAWMTAFYRKRFAEGRAIADAVRDTQREMLRYSRRLHGTGHPFHWAAFVAAGEGH